MNRIRTGIDGLDKLTGGGLPEHSINLVSGPAGSAKSILCAQYISSGARDHEHKGLYISLEEARDDIIRAMDSFGFDLEGLEKEGLVQIVDLGEIRRGQDLDKRRGIPDAKPETAFDHDHTPVYPPRVVIELEPDVEEGERKSSTVTALAIIAGSIVTAISWCLWFIRC